MPTQIITKNSATPSSVPTTGDLTTQGEMAVNVVDKRLFVRDNSTGIQEVGTNPSSLTCSGTANFTATFQLGGVAVTATAADLNKLDGTSATTADFDKLAAVTSTAAELNVLDGISAGLTAAELSKLDGVTATTAELNYVDVTTLGTVQASKAVTADASGNINFNNGNMTNVDIDSGAIDNTAIGAGTPSTGAFTTLSTTGAITQAGSTLDATYLPRNSLTEVVTGTADTLTDAEEGYDLVYTSSSAITVNLHATAPVGFQCTITRAGTGTLTINPGADNLNGDTTDVTIDNQWDTVYILQYSEGNWLAAGSVTKV